jgi:hypothetical protein
MKRFFLIIISTILVFSGSLLSQESSYKEFSGSLQGVKNGGVYVGSSINISNTDKTYLKSLFLRERNTSANIYFKLDLGEDYVKQSANWNFKAEVTFNYNAGNGNISKSLTIDQSTPEVLKIENVLPLYGVYPPSASPLINLNITSVTIDDGATISSPLSGFIKNYLDSNLRLSIKFARAYDLDVRLQSGIMSNGPIISPVVVSNRLATFNWQANTVDAYPNYELQILKLENTDASHQNVDNELLTAVDWSHALKIETQSPLTSFAMNVAEGSGFYTWRVRPIGTYYVGGYANSENYGLWSYGYNTGDTAKLNSTTLSSFPYVFYFKDPDEKINWIYSRIFTEGDYYDKSNPTGIKSNEGMTYADGLLRTRQSQSYNSSDNTNNVSQIVLDYSGRPVLNTLPVPVNGGLTGYKKKFARTPLDSLYRAEYFDADVNYYDPTNVNDNGSSAFKYYSDSTTIPSGVNNSHVADAEGYAFKRTIISNDGLGRVREESGFGKRHSIGSQTLGRGRTKRINYSTPSDDELIRIFGDEAPLSESVIKTYTTDENNVVSIAYTSKEGKTIATALFSEITDNLSELSNSAESLTIRNSIIDHTSTNGKIMGSKTIYLPNDTTEITLSYINDQMPNPGSGCMTGECNLKLRFYIIDLENDNTFISDADSQAGFTDFDSSPQLTFPTDWRFVNKDPFASPLILYPSGSAKDKLKLPRGSYTFVKELSSSNSAGYADSISKAAIEKTKPVIDAIVEKMKNVNSPEAYTRFMNFMDTLKIKMNIFYAGGGITTNDLLVYLRIDSLVPNNYVFPDSSEFKVGSIQTSADDPLKNNVQISTSCCGPMNVPIPKLDICIPCTGHPGSKYQAEVPISQMKTENNQVSADSILPYGISDFRNHSQWFTLNDSLKREAIYDIVDREYIEILKDKMTEEGFPFSDLWKLAPGFSFNSLNFMISNMLISQYYTGRAVRHNGNWYRINPSPDGNYVIDSLISSLNIDFNYDCKSIYYNWLESIVMINSFEVGPADNVVNSFNDYDGQNSAQDNADDDDNWEDMSKRKKKKMKKKLGKELEDFSNSPDGQVTPARKEAISSFIGNFIELSGSQYAAIIDGDSLPGYITSTDKIYPDEYIKPYSFLGTISGAGMGFDFPFTTGVAPYAHTELNTPFLFEINNNQLNLIIDICNGNGYPQLYYPHILKPEWGFKYFVYNKFTNQSKDDFINDTSTIVPHQIIVDVHRHYNEPYSYLPAAVTTTLSPDSLCNFTPMTQYSVSTTGYNFKYHHQNWNMNERNDFYNTIKMAPRCYKGKGIPKDSSFYQTIGNAVQVPTCPTKTELVSEARADLNARINACENLEHMIKTALVNEFESSCYTIVSCKTAPAAGVVSEKEIDFMVSKIINYAKNQISAIKSKFLLLDTTLNIPACSTPDSTQKTYGDSLCSLPSCYQVNCYEIILMDNNTLGTSKSSKLGARYYTDCDEKILAMFSSGDFLPYIPPLLGCNKQPKQWQDSSCGDGSTPCGTNHPVNTYSEKTTCSPSDYKKYSQTYKITASN